MAVTPAEPAPATPPGSAPPPAHGGPVLRLVRLWSVDMPLRLDGVLPRLADALADGTWTSRWPAVTAFAPPAALAVGVVFPLVWVNVSLFGTPSAYTEFPPFLWLAVALGFLSGAAAASLLIGYVVGDLVAGLGYPNGGLLGLLGSIIGYLLLGVGVILTPRLTRWLAADTVRRFPGRTPVATATILVAVQAIAAALLVYVWSQGMVLLIGPVYTFRDTSPGGDAIEPLQIGWMWLVLAALSGVVIRFLAEVIAPAPASTRDLPRTLRRLRRSGRPVRTQPATTGWNRLPLAARAALLAGLVALMLSGLYGNIIEPIAVAVAVFVLAAWQSGIFGSRAPRALPWLGRVPALVRVAAAVAIGFAVSFVLFTIFQADSGTVAVVPGALATMAAFFLLFPAREAPGRAQPAQEARP